MIAKISKKQVEEKLTQVLDPELNISITDLGLVYQIEVNKDNMVTITMTLTTIGCPLISLIEQEIKEKLAEISIPPEKVTIKLTFEPPWSIEKMTPEARAILGR